MEIGPALRRELLSVAEALADAAAERSLPLFRRPGLASDNKSTTGFDPVTEADRDAESAMRAVLRKLRPQDGILGEEHGPKAGSSGLTWVLDPIDGTRAFMSGAPTWGTLIAVNAGSAPVLGIIDQPYTRERFIGAFGAARFRRDDETRDMRVRTCATLGDAILYTTHPEIGSPDERAGFDTVRARALLTRYGLDCYAYALVAMGQIDVVIEAGLQAYDIQGPQGVIEAAGGVVTDWRGGSPHAGGRILAAGDARVHAAALEILARVSD
jgi:histidinol phosphatase-like enzyme (inositol monophosphatase family)